MKRLLLLGGGHAHVHVLQDLARERAAGAEVTLASPFMQQTYSGMVPGLVAGHYAAAQCAIPLLPLARAAGVRFVHSAAVVLDAKQRSVTLANGDKLGYDVLSLDVGGVMDRQVVPGAREHALWVRPIEQFVHWADQMIAIGGERTLDVVVVGGGAAGVELALALQHRLNRMGTGSRLTLVAGPEGVLLGYPPDTVRRGLRALRRFRVVVVNEACTAITASHVHLSNGARLVCDAPVMCIGTSAPPWLHGSGLAQDERGFISTGPTLQSLSHPEVFAAGDVASRPDAPHPRSGVYAVRAGPPLAHNLRRAVAGGELMAYLPPLRTLNLLSCGRRRAILSYGDWSAQGRWVWWLKDRIDRAFVARYILPGEAASAPAPRNDAAA